MPVFEHMLAARKELDDDEQMVALVQVGVMFVDWTDPQKSV
jgi:condensin complex subunit 3